MVEINCTYTNPNLGLLKSNKYDVKYELAALLIPNYKLNNVPGITIMDGKFVSLYPRDRNSFSISSVKYTPVKKFSSLSKERNEKNFLGKKIILGIGRLTKQKNFALLINFFSKIEKKYPEYILIILGEGEERLRLEKLVDSFGLQNKIYIMGYQNNVYKFLTNSEYFILSSLWEDPGFVLIEAALSNSTIISSDCPNGPNEIIVNQKFLFNNNDVDDLCKKFESIKNNLDKSLILNQKIYVKKRIKEFTMFWHFKNLSKLLN